MHVNTIIREMLGDALADAVDNARDRLLDDTVQARCNDGQWLVEVGGATVVEGLTYDACVEAIDALEA